MKMEGQRGMNTSSVLLISRDHSFSLRPMQPARSLLTTLGKKEELEHVTKRYKRNGEGHGSIDLSLPIQR